MDLNTNNSNEDSKLVNKLLAKEEFLQLDKLLNRFNIFSATGMDNWEIKHTKFLTFLLDPNESHALGDFFLRNFVTRLADKFENFPCILDLDFSYATAKSEVSMNNQSKEIKGSLDILIELPRRGLEDSPIIIAVENKIKSKQSQGQLEKYSTSLEEKYKNEDLFRFYLVYNDEEPDEKSWKQISYSNDVLPAVKSTLDIYGERVSPYIKACLKDYLDLLIHEENSESEEDELANLLMADSDIENFIESVKSNTSQKLSDLKIKHRKTIEYLSDFDRDKRSELLKKWKSSYKTNHDYIVIQDDSEAIPLYLRFESSNRSYLRFSILTTENRERLSEMHSTEHKWLENGCPLAFETRFFNNRNGTFDVEVFLTLGPVEPESRLKLLEVLYNSLNKEKKFEEKMLSPRYNRIINAKKKDRSKKNWTNIEDPWKWVNENLISTNNNSEPQIDDWVMNTSIVYNKALTDFFKSRDEI